MKHPRQIARSGDRPCRAGSSASVRRLVLGLVCGLGLVLALGAASVQAQTQSQTPAQTRAKAREAALPPAPVQPSAPEEIRKPILAGAWYPGSAEALSGMIRGFLDRAAPPDPHGRIVGLVAPHAGYVYSGQTAAYAYKAVAGRQYDTVVVVSPSHHVGFAGVSVYDRGGFETPLGVMALDQDFIARLKKADPTVDFLPKAHAKEHALEVHIPFLQTVLPKARLVPLVMGEQGPVASARLAASLARAVGESRGKAVLLVASTDLSHFHAQAQALALDGRFRAGVQAMNPKDLAACLSDGSCEACGAGPVLAVMQAAQALGASKAQVLAQSDSSQASSDRSRVVGYLSAIFVQPEAPAPVSTPAPTPPASPQRSGQPGPGPGPAYQAPPPPARPTGMAPVPADDPARPLPARPLLAQLGWDGPLPVSTRDFPGWDGPVPRLVPAAAKAKPAASASRPVYSASDRALLHAMARESVQARLAGRDWAKPASVPPLLAEKRGAFVTLKKKGRLRGCIGHIVGTQPLYLTVAAMAQAAAFEDPRFLPLKPEEFPDLEFEISVMSPLEKLADPGQVEVGRHGLILRRGVRQGLLLPQVPVEYGWDRRQFLEATCEKAGMEPDCWKDPATEATVFSAEVF